MAEIKALTIDNGGSELRVKPIIETNRLGGAIKPPDKKGVFRDTDVAIMRNRSLAVISQREADETDNDTIIKCPGPFYKLELGEDLRVKDNVNKFHIINIKKSDHEELKGYYGVGITARMYPGEEVAMTSQTLKSDSVAFYQRFIFGVALGLISDAKFQGIEEDDYLGNANNAVKNKKLLDESYIIPIATDIPIEQYNSNKDLPAKIKNGLSGYYEVEFPLLPNKPTVNFTIFPQFTGILPEGGVVVSSISKDFADDEYTLLIDMGHITVEYAIYRGSALVADYVSSSGRAGSTLLTKIISALTSEGIPANKEVALMALTTGKVKEGKNDRDVVSIVKRAKEDFVVNSIKPELSSLYDGTGILPTQISNLVFIGAPMDKGSVTGDMTQKIIEVGGLDKAVEVSLEDGHIRYANINATYKFTGALERMAKKSLKSN